MMKMTAISLIIIIESMKKIKQQRVYKKNGID